ncbi:tetratricopeptide repeat protein [Alteromonadaceae bacterium BrNp21-10]|nr:tetratricopeptide repeat protein [Alteromonadaceae bacterium BrNp21-10]
MMFAHQLKFTVIGLLLALMSACSWNAPVERQAPDERPTLASLQSQMQPIDRQPLTAPSLTELRDSYRKLQQLVKDPVLLKDIHTRLADIEIVLAEQQQEQGIVAADQQQGLYATAIEQLQQVLRLQQQPEQQVDTLYQLSKAYDLQGQRQQSFATIERLLDIDPQSRYLAELSFRRGEIFYADGNYPSAVEAYQQVLDADNNQPYILTAAYMLGWANFKLDRQQGALQAFTVLLDLSLPTAQYTDDYLFDDSPENAYQAILEKLPAGERQLVTDTLRVMALLFSYDAGASSLAEHFQRVGDRHYEMLVYQQLGQFYLNDDRYRDSADVYGMFVKQHPTHPHSPLFYVRQIDTYYLGKFPSLVLPAKQDFVAMYGIHGDLWRQNLRAQQHNAKPYLHQYLSELAQYQHALAQQLDSQRQTESTSSKTASPASVAAAYGQAAGWYQQFIQTFEDDPKTAEMWFMLAECQFAAADYPQAIVAYEQYAYHLAPMLLTKEDPKRRAEAGYAAILAYAQLLTNVDDEQQQHWAPLQLQSQIAFVETFVEDSRSLDILHHLVQNSFTLEQYPQAIQFAELLQQRLPLQDSRQVEASLVLAHSQFALQEYATAEGYYQQVLALLPENDKRVPALGENLAASIYHQAQASLAMQDSVVGAQQAKAQYLQIIEQTPLAKIRMTAQFDLANLYLQLQDWSQAIHWLTDFRQRFAGSALVASIADKLIHAYQQSQQWQLAAEELEQIWQAQPQTEQGQQALLLAAQYQHKQGNHNKALPLFRHYAHEYPNPLSEANEARWKMSEYYRLSNEGNKRRFWLRKMIQAHANNVSQRSDRSAYLAAMSSAVLADDAMHIFKGIKLTLPLKSSLQRKNKTMDAAIKAYQQTAAYNIAEFSSAATFNMAQIYAVFAKDLLDSQRPKSLSALELEQYQFLLEEQAFPFEDKAIEIHEANTRLSWQGVYDEWVQQSFTALSQLLPARYAKKEQWAEVDDEYY